MGEERYGHGKAAAVSWLCLDARLVGTAIERPRPSSASQLLFQRARAGQSRLWVGGGLLSVRPSDVGRDAVTILGPGTAHGDDV